MLRVLRDIRSLRFNASTGLILLQSLEMHARSHGRVRSLLLSLSIVALCVLAVVLGWTATSMATESPVGIDSREIAQGLEPDDQSDSVTGRACASESIGNGLGSSGGMDALAQKTAVAPFQQSVDGDNDYWWDGFGTEGLDDRVEALVVYNDNLIVGGSFTRAAGQVALRIASWDGRSWSQLGGGTNGTVYALAVYDGDLVAGGWFTDADGKTVRNIARWNGDSWSPLGEGINNLVTALTVYGGSLIAGGWFTEADGRAARHIASWDGASWSPLAEGMNGPVHALTVYDGDLIAGGRFTVADSESVNCIARWNGIDWQPIGSGMNDYVDALIVHDENLVASGRFTKAGNQSANRVARWDGESWSSLGQGLGNRVQALAVYNDSLIAGGFFVYADGAACRYVARWNGAAWRPLGSGIGPGIGTAVFALTAYDGSLYVGGDFTLAGQRPSHNIARWDDKSPGLTLGILQNPYLTQYIDIYVVGRETLDPASIDLRVEQQNTPMLLLDPVENVWMAHYKILASSDSVPMSVCATDVIGNESCLTTSFSTRFLQAKAGGIVRSADRRVRLTVGRDALSRDGYVLILPCCQKQWSDGINIPSSEEGATVCYSEMHKGSWHGYRISPEAALSDGEAWLELKYRRSDLEPGMESNQLYIEQERGGPLACVVDPERQTVSAKISHFGAFRLAVGLPGTSEVKAPDFLQVEPIHPNPFTWGTTVRFEIRARQSVSVVVYDIRGRQVRSITDGIAYPGKQETFWDGRSAQGELVPSGMYFIRVQTEYTCAARKVVAVR